jgi:hypothetical protein
VQQRASLRAPRGCCDSCGAGWRGTCSNPSSWRRRNADAAALRGAQGEETAGLGHKYKGNSISTTKYNVATFLPKVQRERGTALF